LVRGASPRTRVAAHAHTFAHQIVLSPHVTACARSAGRHLFEIMLVHVSALA
jgi:hypothetical protein